MSESNSYEQVFDSMGDFVDFLEKTKNPFDNQPEWNCSFTPGRASWWGTDSRKEALELARYGWPEGVQEIEQRTTVLFDEISSLIQRQDIVHDVEGISVDIARFVENEPECWQQWTPNIVESTGNRVLRIVLNISVSAGISHEVMIARGATVAALVELLEYARYRCEVWVTWGGSTWIGGGTGSFHNEGRVLIKAADQDIDKPRLAFSLIHPAMMRRLTLAWIECEPYDIAMKFVPNGHGYPDESYFKGDIYIGKGGLWESQWLDPATAQAWIKDQLKQQGVVLQEPEV